MSRKTRALVIGLGTATLACLAVLAWIWAVWGDLPAQVVTHWGGGGRPDGFTPRDEALFLPLIGLAIALGTGALVIGVTPGKSGSLNGVTGLTAGLGVFLAAVMGGTVALQAGGTQPVRLSVWWMVLAVAVSVIVGLLAARALGPRPPRPVATTIPAASSGVLAPRGRAWSSDVSLHPAFLLLLLIPLALILTVGLGLGEWFTPLLVLLIIGGIGAVTWRWHLAIDQSGFSCRAAVGWPNVRIPLTEIESAEALRDVSLFTYGGPGLRVGRSGSALMLRGGEAVKLNLSDGTEFLVTTPDAGVGAALINQLAVEQRSRA